MFELINLKGNTYCYTMPTNSGIYVDSDGGVYLIDTGVNERSAQRLLTAIGERGWSVKAVILTHAHTDHAGGCRYIVENTDAKAYATEAERIFVKHPDLEPAVVYGAFPCRDFRSKFMNTPACDVEDINNLILPEGMEIIHLPGHFADMIGIKTPDDVYFVADAVVDEKTLALSPMSYNFDVECQYETLSKIKSLEGKICVPSHALPTKEITALADANKAAMDTVAKDILKFLSTPCTLEDLAEKFADKWNLPVSYLQHVMTCAGVRGFLTYLRHNSRVEYIFEGSRMLWKNAEK